MSQNMIARVHIAFFTVLVKREAIADVDCGLAQSPQSTATLAAYTFMSADDAERFVSVLAALGLVIGQQVGVANMIHGPLLPCAGLEYIREGDSFVCSWAAFRTDAMVSQVSESALIDSEGHLRFPLYHGTSLHRWNSISSEGLGARDVLQDLGVWEVWTQLCGHLQRIDEPNCQWALKRRQHRIDATLRDRGKASTNADWNFRYGSVYLSGSKAKAATYACRGYGSELVRDTAELIEILRAHKPEQARDIELQSPAFAADLQADHAPVLIQIDRVHVDEVRTERGESARAKIQIFEKRRVDLPIKLKPSLEPFIFEAVIIFAPERLKANLVNGQMGNFGFGSEDQFILTDLD